MAGRFVTKWLFLQWEPLDMKCSSAIYHEFACTAAQDHMTWLTLHVYLGCLI